MIEDRDDRHGVGAPAGPSRRLEACQSPVWDTALAMLALSDAGLAGEHPAMVRAAEWLLGRGGHGAAATGRSRARSCARAAGRSSSPTTTTPTSTTPPRWCSRCSASPAPRTPITRPTRPRTAAPRRESWRRASTAPWRGPWSGSRGCRAASGGWGAFDADNTRTLARELPFLDFGEVIDEPSADVTAHAVEMFAALGLRERPASRRGGALAARQPGGRRLVVRALGRQPRLRDRGRRARAGRRRASAARRRASAGPCRWLERHQNEDGGWGEDPRSYDDPRGSAAARAPPRRRRGRCSRCTPPASARRPLRRGVRWLVETQRADGGWDEPQYTGTGFPVRLLHQLPPLPADVPDDGARAGACGSGTATAERARPPTWRRAQEG